MISRLTLFSLLLTLLLATGIWRWSDAQRDDCSRHPVGINKAPATEWVMSGSRMIEVPCNFWLMRQPDRVQVLCLLDFVLAVVFVLNALADARNWLEMRRRRRMH